MRKWILASALLISACSGATDNELKYALDSSFCAGKEYASRTLSPIAGSTLNANLRLSTARFITAQSYDSHLKERFNAGYQEAKITINDLKIKNKSSNSSYEQIANEAEMGLQGQSCFNKLKMSQDVFAKIEKMSQDDLQNYSPPKLSDWITNN